MVSEVILLRKHHAEQASLDQLRGKLELFFWAARETLKLVMWAALVAYLVVCLVSGTDPVVRWLPALR
jgi:hypothetical protein